jgi:hypothetical protein
VLKPAPTSTSFSSGVLTAPTGPGLLAFVVVGVPRPERESERTRRLSVLPRSIFGVGVVTGSMLLNSSFEGWEGESGGKGGDGPWMQLDRIAAHFGAQAGGGTNVGLLGSHAPTYGKTWVYCAKQVRGSLRCGRRRVVGS